MANGITRNAISQLIIKGKSAPAEMEEEMSILAAGKAPKINLKASASEHNHSSESLHSRK